MSITFYREGSHRRIALNLEVKAFVFSGGIGAWAPVEGGPMITGRTKNVSDKTRYDAGLSDPDLWLRYFALGGMGTPDQVRSYLTAEVVPSAHDHDVLAQALNERFSELGRNHPVQYAGVIG